MEAFLKLITAIAESPLRVLIFIPKLIIGAILTWQYERRYIDAISRQFQERNKLYASIEVWAQETSPGGLPLLQTRKQMGLLLNCIDGYRRVVLLGETGSGKTSSLQRVAQEYTSRAQRKRFGAPTIPIYAILSDLKNPTVSGIIEMLQTTVESYERTAWLERQGLRWGRKVCKHLDELLEDGRIILLLDGINEIPGDIRSKALVALQEFLSLPKYSDSRVILATRPGAYEDEVKLELDQLILMPLSDKAMKEFLAARGVHAETSVRHLENINLKDACRNPGVLAMFADLYRRAGLDLPLNRGQVLKGYTNELLRDGKHNWNSSYDWRFVDSAIMIKALGRVAYEMLSMGTVRLPVVRVGELMSSGLNRTGVEPSDVLEESSFCLLTEYLADRTEMRFKHDLLLYYLVAEELEWCLREKAQQDFRALILDERWWEPMLLQADITAHPLSFVRSIVESSSNTEAKYFLALGCLLSINTRE